MKNKLRKKSYRLKTIWLQESYINENFSLNFLGFKSLFGDLFRRGRNGRKKGLK